MCKTGWLKAKHDLNLKFCIFHANVFLKKVSYGPGKNLVSKENSF